MASTTVTPADLWRLAEEAERRGVRIFHEPISHEHYALSGSDPTKLYRLTHSSCTCRGSMRWQRCGHWALFLAHLGWLPEVDPEPDPAPPTPVLAPALAAERCNRHLKAGPVPATTVTSASKTLRSRQR